MPRIKDIAADLGITENRVRKLRDQGVFPPSRSRATIAEHRTLLAEHEGVSRKAPTREGSEDTIRRAKAAADREEAQARKARADADRAERLAKIETGELVPASDLVEVVQQMQRLVHETFGDLGPMLAAQIGLTPRQQAAAEGIVDRLRSQIRRGMERLE